jgi:hypothetical protein
VDPKHPGAVDEILNFGKFWNEEGIRKSKSEIIKITDKIGKLFKRAYRYFAAAKAVRDDMEIIYEEALDRGKFHKEVTGLKKEIFSTLEDTEKQGKVRHLFGSALSPNGVVDHYETIIGKMKKIYYIEGSYIKGISNFLEEMVNEGIKKGLHMEAYHEPLDEKNIEALLIPELNVAITASNKYADTNYKKISVDAFIDKVFLTEKESFLKEDQVMMEKLMKAGLSNIAKAKKAHDELEKFYVSNMNFEGIDQLKEKIMNRILEYEKEVKG